MRMNSDPLLEAMTSEEEVAPLAVWLALTFEGVNEAPVSIVVKIYWKPIEAMSIARVEPTLGVFEVQVSIVHKEKIRVEAVRIVS